MTMLFKLISDAIREPFVLIATAFGAMLVAVAMANWPILTSISVVCFAALSLLALIARKPH